MSTQDLLKNSKTSATISLAQVCCDIIVSLLFQTYFNILFDVLGLHFGEEVQMALSKPREGMKFETIWNKFKIIPG